MVRALTSMAAVSERRQQGTGRMPALFAPKAGEASGRKKNKKACIDTTNNSKMSFEST